MEAGSSPPGTAFQTVESAVLLEGKQPTSRLTSPDRLRLLAISYIELLFDFGLIHFALALLVQRPMYEPTLESIEDAIYFSVVTMTTIGYGDIKPVWLLTGWASYASCNELII